MHASLGITGIACVLPVRDIIAVIYSLLIYTLLVISIKAVI